MASLSAGDAPLPRVRASYGGSIPGMKKWNFINGWVQEEVEEVVVAAVE